MKSEKDDLIQDKLESLFKKLQWSMYLVPNIPRVPIESNFYNTCPMDMKLNQSGQDMYLLGVCKLEILIVVS